MKKTLLCLFIACLLFIPAFSFAEIDLSGLSYEELIALKDKINLAIWNSEVWEEVEVPQGIWEVGIDIPEGHWTIKPVYGVYAYVRYGNALEPNGKEVSYKSNNYIYQNIYSSTSSLYDEGADLTEIDLDAKAGNYIEISSGNVIFSPYSGKPSLGFKANK